MVNIRDCINYLILILFAVSGRSSILNCAIRWLVSFKKISCYSQKCNVDLNSWLTHKKIVIRCVKQSNERKCENITHKSGRYSGAQSGI